MTVTSSTKASITYIESQFPDDAFKDAHHPEPGQSVFKNPWPSFQPIDPEKTKQYLKRHSLWNTWAHPSTTEAEIPIYKPSFIAERHGVHKLRATWLGHACYLIEFPSGLRALFDPVLTDRCSPFRWVGPKRFTELPCQISDIPFIDIVIISHNHYDHLSYPTVLEIKKHHPDVQFFVPMGNLQWFHDSGIHQVTEMDWWQDVQYKVSIDVDHVQQQQKSESKRSKKESSLIISARVSCLPAQHTTGRTPFGTDKSLWASWGCKSPDELSPEPPSVYFAGDTGYRGIPTCSLNESTEDIDDNIKKYGDLSVCPAFAQIGELRGPFSLGLIPIGAYAPRALMAGIHASPLDAVEIMKDTRCKKALAMHWGTWVMGAEDVREPPALLRKALSTSGLRETGTFDVVGIGESREFD